MRLLVALLVITTAVAAASAQGPQPGEKVDLTAARVPDLVVVDHRFTVSVDVVNRQTEEASIQLHSFLYRPSEDHDCGSYSSERFLGGADRGARPSITLAPGESRTYPPEGTPWWHMVNASQVMEDGTYELCVFALEPGTPEGVTWYDYEAVDLRVRVVNTLPNLDFSWQPDRGNVTTEFRFEADAGDDAEGDPLTFTWDFGHLDTKGRATAEGRVVTHQFFHFGTSPRQYLVNLTVDDGFDTTTVTKTVVVDPEGVARPQKVELGGGEEAGPWFMRLLPGPGAPLVALLAAGAALARGRRAGSP